MLPSKYIRNGNVDWHTTKRSFGFYCESFSTVASWSFNKLIKIFSNILLTLSSGYYIKIIQQFHQFGIETASKCVELYDGYKISATVHTLLIHGADIIESQPSPLGQL